MQINSQSSQYYSAVALESRTQNNRLPVVYQSQSKPPVVREQGADNLTVAPVKQDNSIQQAQFVRDVMPAVQQVSQLPRALQHYQLVSLITTDKTTGILLDEMV